MQILITGNLGYIGTRLVEKFNQKNFDIVGLDIGFYANDILEPIRQDIIQFNYDIRNIKTNVFKDIDVLIHTAAMSNDPLGELNANITNQINFESTVNLFSNAIANGVKQIIFISTQSIYGYSDINKEMTEDDDNKNPITEYAKTKWKTELKINELKKDCHFTILRPSTVFGYSKRIRSDIVLNNLVIEAYINKKIKVLSDGSPWRPVVHIDDLCDCIITTVNSKEMIESGEAFNIGINNGNFQVSDLALKVSKAFNNMDIDYINEHTDPRSYRVNFEKFNSRFHKIFKPFRSLDFGIYEMIDNFKRVNLNKIYSEDMNFKRLSSLKKLISNRVLDNDLYFNDI